jgi:hypothetical protein
MAFSQELVLEVLQKKEARQLQREIKAVVVIGGSGSQTWRFVLNQMQTLPVATV